jgi:hypothetical protein
MGFRLGMFSKNFWAYQFVALAITSAISGVQNYSKYSRELQGSSKSTFMQGLPTDGECGCSSPDFCSYAMLHAMLSLTLSLSHDKIFTFISLLLLHSLSEISLY